jgi:protein-tyrosine phosphatase
MNLSAAENGVHMKWPHDDFFHAWWVEPDRLLAGEYPGAPTRTKAITKLRLLADAGVDTIIDLTEDVDGLEPYSHLLDEIADDTGHSIRRYRHPIPDNHVIDDAGYDNILARINAEISSGRMVYMHCWGGRGRTSTVVGCRLIEHGLDYDATIARLRKLRSNTKKAAVEVPESQSQHDVLRRRANPARW